NLPHASACRLGFSFGARIAAVAENVVDRVALAHKHFADIGNISGGADGEGAAVTIQAVWYASNAAFGNQLRKPLSCFPTAMPLAALRVAAGLMQLWSVNSDKPDLSIVGLQRVSVDDPHARDRLGVRRAGLMPQADCFCTDCRGDNENAEKQTYVRRT